MMPIQRLSTKTQTFVLVLGAGLIALALFAINVRYSSHQEWVRGQTADQKGDLAQAIVHYERAIKWYTPFSRSVRQAVARLWEIGAAAEARAEVSLALNSYRALRGSLYAVQSLYQPYQSWIPKCEDRIATLMPATIPADRQGRATPEQHQARFSDMFQRDVGPKLGWSLLVVFGFLAWVGATIGLIWCVDTQSEKWKWRYGWQWSCGIIVGLASWIAGMLNA